MATVYQSATPLNPTDLLQKLVAFLAANGWTTDSSVADGAGWRAHLHRGSTYVNFRAAINEGAATMFDDTQQNPWSGIALYLGDGYSSGQSWKNQSGGPKNKDTPARTVGAGMATSSGAMSAAHFFAHDGGDHITVVVENSANIFRHMGWGISLNKLGSWTGGPYFYGTTSGNYLGLTWGNYPGFNYSAVCPLSLNDPRNNTACASFVRADVDTFTGKWLSVSNVGGGNLGNTGKQATSLFSYTSNLQGMAPAYAGYAQRTTNTLNTQSLLLPIRLLAARDSGGYSFIGTAPHVFLCNAIAKGFTVGGTYLWGGNSYMVFPGSSDRPDLGFAVRKV